MKILHTSDWHLGKRLGPFSRIPEQRQVLEEILEICRQEQPDLILVSGDLFDAFNPPNEAVELLYSSLKKLTREGRCPVVALAGNHDSPDRIEAPDPLARECGIFFLGYPDTLPGPAELESGVRGTFPAPGLLELTLPSLSHPVRILCAPFANEARLRRFLGQENREEALRKLLEESWGALAGEYCDSRGVNLFAGHFFMTGRGDLFSQEQEEPEGERPILCPGGLDRLYTDNLPRQIQYAALGHLHRYQEVPGGSVPAVYSGSPLAYSLSEADQEKYAVLVTAEPGKPASFRKLPLSSGRPIFRMTFDTEDQGLAWLEAHPDCWVEITLKTDDYIRSETKRKFLEAHDGILELNLQRSTRADDSDRGASADPGRSVRDLFVDYFKEQNGGVEPGEELLELFSQLLAREEGE